MPSDPAADTARATLIAALVDAPPELLTVVGSPTMPRGRPGRTAAVVLAFIVDSMGRIDPESMTIVHREGDVAFARRACEEVPKTRFAPLGKPGPVLGLVPFISFSNSMPPEFMNLPRRARTTLENMSTVERRDFLLNKSCQGF
jgi:hypothetical protein